MSSQLNRQTEDRAVACAPSADGAVGEADQALEVAAGKRAKAKRKRLIGSIPRRTMVNYILYAAILLAVMWVIFLLGINWYYDRLVKNGINDARQAATSAFPKQGEETALKLFYKYRLSELSRSHSCAIVVFSYEDGVAVTAAIKQIEHIIPEIIRNGVQSSMNKFNKKNTPTEKEEK